MFFPAIKQNVTIFLRYGRKPVATHVRTCVHSVLTYCVPLLTTVLTVHTLASESCTHVRKLLLSLAELRIVQDNVAPRNYVRSLAEPAFTKLCRLEPREECGTDDQCDIAVSYHVLQYTCCIIRQIPLLEALRS